jgi:3-hydroxyisobutyrate dehydrogenase-like beta-hydroxyacid dehydrogenase
MVQVGDTIGVVGLGAMGGPVARHLASRGFAALGYDRDPDAAAALASDGVEPAVLDALTGAAAVLLFVPGDRDVLDLAAAFAAMARAPRYTIICSSVTPATCRAAAATLEGRSVVVDAALTGGVRAAEAGRINLLVGGADDAVSALQPVLGAFSATLHHLGPLGSGQVGKTVNNLLHWGEIALIVEALELGAALGVPAARLRQALYDGPTDGRTLHDLEEFRLTWWAKDLDNAFAMADQAGGELPVSRLVHDLMPAITVERLRRMISGEGVPAGTAT